MTSLDTDREKYPLSNSILLQMKDKLRSPSQGADTAVWLAVSPAALEQQSGLFFQGRNFVRYLPKNDDGNESLLYIMKRDEYESILAMFGMHHFEVIVTDRGIWRRRGGVGQDEWVGERKDKKGKDRQLRNREDMR